MSSRTAIRDPVIFCHSAPDQDPGRNPEKYKGQTISVWLFLRSGFRLQAGMTCSGSRPGMTEEDYDA